MRESFLAITENARDPGSGSRHLQKINRVLNVLDAKESRATDKTVAIKVSVTFLNQLSVKEAVKAANFKEGGTDNAQYTNAPLATQKAVRYFWICALIGGTA